MRKSERLTIEILNDEQRKDLVARVKELVDDHSPSDISEVTKYYLGDLNALFREYEHSTVKKYWEASIRNKRIQRLKEEGTYVEPPKKVLPKKRGRPKKKTPAKDTGKPKMGQFEGVPSERYSAINLKNNLTLIRDILPNMSLTNYRFADLINQYLPDKILLRGLRIAVDRALIDLRKENNFAISGAKENIESILKACDAVLYEKAQRYF